MGVLPSFTGECPPVNITLNSSSNQDQHSISIPLQPDDQGSVSYPAMTDTQLSLFLLIIFHPAFSKTRGLLNFYSISYLYFGAMATSFVILVGVIVSYATGEEIQANELLLSLAEVKTAD